MDILREILKQSSFISKNLGEKLFKNNKIKNVDSKIIDGIKHIYGLVEDGVKIERSHIKINTSIDKITGVSCSCETFQENSQEIRNYMCSHIVATSYVLEKNNKEIVKTEVNKNKRTNEDTIEIILKEEKDKTKDYYILELKVGKDQKVIVESIPNFLYKTNKFDFEKEEYNPIKFLSSKGKDENRIINGRSFIIYKQELKEFLELVSENKTISLTHSYMPYSSKVYKEDMPIALTFKRKGKMIILSQQKKVNFPIDEMKKVWIYDKKIYLPSDEQIKYYSFLYSKFDKEEKAEFNLTKENLEKLMVIAKKITKKIKVDESIEDDFDLIDKPNFYIKREDNNLYINLIINNETQKNDIKFMEKIEIALDSLRFIRDKIKDRYIFIGNDEEEFKFFNGGYNKLRNFGFVKTYEKKDFTKIIKSKHINSEIIVEDDNYIFSYEIEDIAYDELGSLLNALNNGASFYKNKKGSFLDLKDEATESFLLTLQEINGYKTVYKNKIIVDNYKLLHLDSGVKERNISLIKNIEAIKSPILNIKNRKDKYSIPKEIDATLREYQIEGFNFIKNLETLKLGGILADEMGLGKTLQAITYLAASKGKKTLIICPTSLIFNWTSEIEKFYKDYKVCVMHGSLKERNKVKESYMDYDCIITSYGTLRQDEDFYLGKTFDNIILDEAQNIKNSKASITELIKGLDGKFKLALTGTPMENNLMELWSIFDFIMPNYLYREERFKLKFLGAEEGSLKDLKNLISPFILRRLKKDVLSELPDKIEKDRYIIMSKNQKQAYISYMKDIKKKLKENKKNKIVIFSYLTVLRQLALDPKLVLENYNEESPKVKEVISIIKRAKEENKKLLIFSQFTKVLENLGQTLKANNYDYLYLNGATKSKDRIDLVNKFNEEKDDVFLISLKAGGVGLNLTSANIVIHLDPWWNPAVQDQATDRAHRIGQKNIVEVIRLISKDTIEEKIIKLQESKKELIENILDSENLKSDKISKITEDELLELFN